MRFHTWKRKNVKNKYIYMLWTAAWFIKLRNASDRVPSIWAQLHPDRVEIK